MTDDDDKGASRRRTLEIAAGVAIATVAGKSAEAATPNVVGVWKLAGGSTTDPSGKQVAVPYGPRGMGLVSLTSDGRMMAVLVDGRSKLPDGTKREYSSYCGNYTFDGKTLITTVDASSDAGRLAVGGQQVRQVRFDGDRMILVPPERDDGGVKLRRELVWERINAMSL
jgi:Lipocalin-like domain